jgi:hypothetical protein
MPARLCHFPARLGVLISALYFFTPVLAQAQEPAPAQVDSLRTEVRRLQAQLDSIRAMLERGEASPGEEVDAITRLRAAAQAAARAGADTTQAQPAAEQQFVGRGRSLQALNPEISVSGDLYAAVQTEDPDGDNFIPREFEISFQSALDPFSRAKVFLAAEQEGAGIEVFAEEGEEHGHGDGIVVEESYVEYVNLPGGFGIKAGRFFQQFGQLNRWHTHALPFQSRSLPHLVFIGEEPLAQDGASLRWLLPTSPGAGAYEITLEGTRSRNETLFGGSNGPSLLGHFNAFWQLSESTDLEIGISGIVGDFVEEHDEDDAGDEEEALSFSNRLYGIETAFNWIPPGASRYRGFTLRAGAMLSAPEAPTGPDPDEALGLWALAEFKLDRQWILGGRYGWVENPNDTDETAWLVSPALTYWQSEFVRLRAEYDIVNSAGDTSGIFTLRLTFAMGPHKHETY